MKNRYGAKKFDLTKRVIAVIMIAVFFVLSTLPLNATPSNTDQSIGIDVNAKSAILIEASTGKVLYEKNADEALPPASVTKVMTLLLVMEAIEQGKIAYGDTVRASANACSMGGSQIFLEENEEMSVEDLIKSVVIASANDAAVALAEYIAGTEEAFVEQMNKKASALGMKNTTFENTNGLDDTVQNHLTSARDIAIMSRELIKYPKITEYSSIWMDSIRNGEFGLTNTNRLVRFYKGATGLKTGSTAKAGFCISATAKRNDMELICVIMGAQSRDIRNAAAVSLLDYGFANFGVYQKSGDKIDNIPIKKGLEPDVDAEYNSFSAVLKKNEIGNITQEIKLVDGLEAPIEKGAVIGQVTYKSADGEIGKSDIIATETVDKMTFWGMFVEFLKKCSLIV